MCALAITTRDDWKYTGEVTRGIALGLLAAGAAARAGAPGVLRVDALGGAALVGACAAWALDTNLTQRLSIRDPVALVRFKVMSGGACTLTLGLAFGGALPDERTALTA